MPIPGPLLPTEDLQAIARILAAGYLRLLYPGRGRSPLDTPEKSSPHVHEVDASRRENHVEETIEQEIAELSRMTVGQLKQRYIEVFGAETRSNNRQFLFRRIAWRIQALAEGGLSERARRRALEIANDADIRVRAPIVQAIGFGRQEVAANSTGDAD